MAVITFANTKGGAGKTTALLLLATELIRRGNRVCVVDTDPQRNRRCLPRLSAFQSTS
jgi:chromosome partitioning protein